MNTTLVASSSIDLAPVAWTPLAELTEHDWLEEGRALQRVGRAWQWWLGDWILYGEHRYGETYTAAVQQTGLEPSTLIDIAYVCRHVEPSVRTEQLTWSHHKIVAPLAPDEQRRWLQRAIDQEMSVAALREAIKTSQNKNPLNPPDDPPAITHDDEQEPIGHDSLLDMLASLAPGEELEMDLPLGGVTVHIHATAA